MTCRRRCALPAATTAAHRGDRDEKPGANGKVSTIHRSSIPNPLESRYAPSAASIHSSNRPGESAPPRKSATILSPFGAIAGLIVTERTSTQRDPQRRKNRPNCHCGEIPTAEWNCVFPPEFGELPRRQTLMRIRIGQRLVGDGAG